MFKFMDVTCRELEIAFKSKKESWDLVCFCVRKIFATNFKAARDLAAGVILNSSGAPRCFHTAIKVMCKAEDFLSIGARNHPALKSTMVRFVMVMSNGTVQLAQGVKELKESFKVFLVDLTNEAKERNILKKKNEYLQDQVDKLRSVAGTEWVLQWRNHRRGYQFSGSDRKFT